MPIICELYAIICDYNDHFLRIYAPYEVEKRASLHFCVLKIARHVSGYHTNMEWGLFLADFRTSYGSTLYIVDLK